MARDSTTSLTPDSQPSRRLPEILERLRTEHPDARCALDHSNPFELLVATILSAQCTDVRVNQVTLALFTQFPTPEALASATQDEVEELIRPTGFHRQKTRFLRGMAQMVASQHEGEVPANMDELVEMPGVARKTANVVLGVAFGLAEGIVVDTHVKRLSNRLGLTRQSDPVKIERDLMELVPPEDWIDFSHLLIFHGRRVCRAQAGLSELRSECRVPVSRIVKKRNCTAAWLCCALVTGSFLGGLVTKPVSTGGSLIHKADDWQLRCIDSFPLTF